MTKKKKLTVEILVLLTLVVGWGTYNYTNYVQSQQIAQTLIEENVSMIDETYQEVNEEQKMVLNVQRTLGLPETGSDEALTMSMEDEFGEDTPETRIGMELERRVNALEEEKVVLSKERNYVIETVSAMHSIFNKVNVSNPFVNLFFLPLLVYFFKKCIDLGFKILTKRCAVDTA